jgi:hypothetical protein
LICGLLRTSAQRSNVRKSFQPAGPLGSLKGLKAGVAGVHEKGDGRREAGTDGAGP